MSLKWYTYSLVVLLSFLSLGQPLSTVALESSSENNIKAAYLFNFAKFVEWPKTAFETNSSAVNVWVFGDDPLVDILETLENKTVTGRPLTIHHGNYPEAIQGCHILYISESEKKNLKIILDAFKAKPVLTVSSLEHFTGHGGMIRFIHKGSNIRFEVNLEAVSHSGLTISSRLLKLAVIVDGSRGH